MVCMLIHICSQRHTLRALKGIHKNYGADNVFIQIYHSICQLHNMFIKLETRVLTACSFGQAHGCYLNFFCCLVWLLSFRSQPQEFLLFYLSIKMRSLNLNISKVQIVVLKQRGIKLYLEREFINRLGPAGTHEQTRRWQDIREQIRRLRSYSCKSNFSKHPGMLFGTSVVKCKACYITALDESLDIY